MKERVLAFFSENSGKWGRQQTRKFGLIVKGAGMAISCDPDAGWIGYYAPNGILAHEEIDYEAADRLTARMLNEVPREGDDKRYDDFR